MRAHIPGGGLSAVTAVRPYRLTSASERHRLGPSYDADLYFDDMKLIGVNVGDEEFTFVKPDDVNVTELKPDDVNFTDVKFEDVKFTPVDVGDTKVTAVDFGGVKLTGVKLGEL